MAKYPLIHCDLDDPEVCRVCTEKNSGTYYKVVEGTTYCPLHGGNSQLLSQQKKAANQYRLQVWQKRVSEFSENESIKTLRGEIGILRMLLEENLNRCTEASQLLTYSNKISDLVLKIEKLVTSCDKLEKNMGLMLDKGAALQLATNIVNLIASEISDPVVIDNISNGIIDLLRDL